MRAVIWYCQSRWIVHRSCVQSSGVVSRAGSLIVVWSHHLTVLDLTDVKELKESYQVESLRGSPWKKLCCQVESLRGSPWKKISYQVESLRGSPWKSISYQVESLRGSPWKRLASKSSDNGCKRVLQAQVQGPSGSACRAQTQAKPWRLCHKRKFRALVALQRAQVQGLSGSVCRAQAQAGPWWLCFKRKFRALVALLAESASSGP